MKYINNFLKHLKNQNYSNETIKDYSYILLCFRKYLKTINIFDEKNVNENHFKDYIEKYKNSNKYSMYYINVIRIKKYFRFLAEFNYIFISPVEKMQNPKQVTRHHPILNRNEITSILDGFNDDNFIEIRSRAVLELLYSSALRPGECRNMEMNDIDYFNKTILIKKTKTKTDRIVPVTKQALYWINEYITKVRTKYINKKDDNKLFISIFKGRQISRNGLKDSIKRSLIKKNAKHFSLYSIRATSATHLFENGMSINHLQILLGHHCLQSTQIYVRVSLIKLKEILEKFHPRKKLENLKQEEEEN